MTVQVDRLSFCKKGPMSVTGPSSDDQLDLRFGRCRYFIVADSESDSFESIDNEAAASMGGAGLQAAQTLTDALDRNRFINAIQTLPRTVFRIKGVVELTDTDKPLLFQYVGGRFEFSEFNNPILSDRFLILIGQEMPVTALETLFGNILSMAVTND